MQVTIRYETLLKRAAGVASQTLELDETDDVREVVSELAAHANDKVKSMLVDGSGSVQPSLLIFVNDRQVSATESVSLADGDEVTLMSPISGG